MKNNKGFSLTELLVTIAILTIMSGIAVVSYNSYIPEVKKRKLCDSAILFAVGAKTCIMNIGGWNSYDKACKAITTADLKKKFDYKCPVVEDTAKKNGCKGEEATNGDCYCLRIKKDKYHIFVHLKTDKLDYQIHSGDSDDPANALLFDCDCDFEQTPNYSFESNDNKEFCEKHIESIGSNGGSNGVGSNGGGSNGGQNGGGSGADTLQTTTT